MGFLKDKWTEEEVLNLPDGEHNFFDRKAGKLFGSRHELYRTLAKALSAFSNSGGGHIVLGQSDDGAIDGVPSKEGRTPIREWLEQKVPTLVSYPLEAFRVHSIHPDPTTCRIPTDKVVVVIDVDDSRLAPHQASFPRDDPQYYYRQAGKSLPAPHHYLEALRNRLIYAVLNAQLEWVGPGRAYDQADGTAVLEVQIRFSVKNESRVACRAWTIGFDLYNKDRGLCSDVKLRQEYPVLGQTFVVDPSHDVVLPTRTCSRTDVFGFQFKSSQPPGWQFGRLFELEMDFYPLSENHIGQTKTTRLGDVIDKNQFEQRGTQMLGQAGLRW